MTITHKKVSSKVSVCTCTTSVVVYRLYVLCVLIWVNFCHLRPSTLYFLLSIDVISIYGFSLEVVEIGFQNVQQWMKLEIKVLCSG